MTKYRYSWSRKYGADAQVIGTWIQQLPIRTPQTIVEAAADPISPAHQLFTWDDSAAAQRWRLAEAGMLVSSLRVEIIDHERKVQRISAFIGGSDRGSYVPVLEATADELTEAQAKCWRDMQTFRQRHKGLEIAASIISEMQKVELSLARKKKRAR